MRRSTVLIMLAGLCTAGPALAQEDPIGALLGDQPQAASEPAQPPAPAAPAAAPEAAPAPAPAPGPPVAAEEPEDSEEAATPSAPGVTAVQTPSPTAVETPLAPTAAQTAPALETPAAPVPAPPPAQAAAASPAPATVGLPSAPIPYRILGPSAVPVQPPPAMATVVVPAQTPAPAYARPPAASPYSPYPSAPLSYANTPPPSSRVRSSHGAPVQIDQRDLTPEAPPTAREIDYEQRLRTSFASAQGLQGPLDGSWILSVDGDDRYSLELVDRSSGVMEGAWRDLGRAGALNASGFVEDIQRYGGQLTFRFRTDGRSDPAVATLAVGADGRWSGELVRGRERRAVILRRN